MVITHLYKYGHYPPLAQQGAPSLMERMVRMIGNTARDDNPFLYEPLDYVTGFPHMDKYSCEKLYGAAIV